MKKPRQRAVVWCSTKRQLYWLHKEKQMLENALSSSNSSLVEVTHLKQEVQRTPGQMSCCHTDSTDPGKLQRRHQAQLGGNAEVRGAALHLAPHWEQNPLKQQFYTPESHNPDLSLSEMQVSAFLKKHSVKNWFYPASSNCFDTRKTWESVSPTIPPAWKLRFRNPTILPLDLFGDQ